MSAERLHVGSAQSQTAGPIGPLAARQRSPLVLWHGRESGYERNVGQVFNLVFHLPFDAPAGSHGKDHTLSVPTISPALVAPSSVRAAGKASMIRIEMVGS